MIDGKADWEFRLEFEYYPAFEAELKKTTRYIEPKLEELQRFFRFVDKYVREQHAALQENQAVPVEPPPVIKYTGTPPDGAHLAPEAGEAADD